MMVVVCAWRLLRALRCILRRLRRHDAAIIAAETFIFMRLHQGQGLEEVLRASRGLASTALRA